MAATVYIEAPGIWENTDSVAHGIYVDGVWTVIDAGEEIYLDNYRQARGGSNMRFLERTLP